MGDQRSRSTVLGNKAGASRVRSSLLYMQVLLMFSRSSNVHEESYMPFLFSSKSSASDKDDDDDGNTGVPARSAVGRRVFNKKGKEDVIHVRE